MQSSFVVEDRLMRSRTGVVALLAGATLGIACGSDERSTTSPNSQTFDVDSSKVDPAVLNAIARDDSVSVIVLGKSQLLEPVGGLERFAQSHEQTPRKQLRTEVVSQLRSIAAADQADIRSVIGAQRRVRQLWIYNAVAGTLSRSEIAQLSKRPSVAFVFANAGERVTFARGDERVSLLIPNAPPPPFNAGSARTAWHIRWLGVDRVWSELAAYGEGAVVASIDDGVNYAHADLRTHIWRNTSETPNNGRDDDGNGYADDVYGYDFDLMTPEVRSTSLAAQHGTWTAGLMVADGTSGTMSGVAPRARLMVLRGGGPVAIAEAMQYAIAMGADVVNMSFTYRNEGLRRALWRMMSDHAVAAGALLAGGAGNFQMTDAVPNQIASPKDSPSVLVAGGIDTTLQLQPFSSTGPVEWGSVRFYGDYPLPAGLVKPDVVAFPGPGLTLLSLADAGYLGSDAVAGNSFSGPQVAGVGALMMGVAPTIPGGRARALIEATARDIPPAGKDTRTGRGLVDAVAAVRAARSLKRP
jgi:subtilisin family serine protease